MAISLRFLILCCPQGLAASCNTALVATGVRACVTGYYSITNADTARSVHNIIYIYNII
jgi:hypothetical protein